MQRVSGGLAVPKQMLDIFTGKTTGVGANIGLVECDLTYLPKGIDNVFVATIITMAPGNIAHPELISLVGKQLTIKVSEYWYAKANTPIDGANSGGAGADPHDHTLNFTATECEALPVSGRNVEAIRVSYNVA